MAEGAVAHKHRIVPRADRPIDAFVRRSTAGAPPRAAQGVVLQGPTLAKAASSTSSTSATRRPKSLAAELGALFAPGATSAVATAAKPAPPPNWCVRYSPQTAADLAGFQGHAAIEVRNYVRARRNSPYIGQQ